MEFNYVLLVYDMDSVEEEINIVHIVTYPNEPTEQDADDLKMELSEDDEYGLSNFPNLGFINTKLTKTLTEDVINSGDLAWSNYLPDPIPTDGYF